MVPVRFQYNFHAKSSPRSGLLTTIWPLAAGAIFSTPAVCVGLPTPDPVQAQFQQYRDAEDLLQKGSAARGSIFTQNFKSEIWFCEDSFSKKVPASGAPSNPVQVAHDQLQKQVKKQVAAVRMALIDNRAATASFFRETVPVSMIVSASFPFSGGVFRAMRELRAYGERDLAEFDNFAAGQLRVQATPVGAVPGVENFDCKADLGTLRSQLDWHQRAHSRLAGLYGFLGLLQAVQRRFRHFRQEMNGKDFLTFGRCAGVEEAISGIDAALAREIDALESLVKFNSDKAQELQAYSLRLSGLQARCASAK